VILHGKPPFLVFEPLWGLIGATYTMFIFRLIGKHVEDFLLVITELFC